MTMNISAPLVLAALLGCTGDIGENTKTSEGDSTNACVSGVDGVITTTLDATSEEEWVYFDFESCGVATVIDPQADVGWDLAVRRFNPKLNGGVSGSGGVEVTAIDGADFDALSEAPKTVYASDAEDDDEDGVPDYALESWFDYDMADHTLSPADLVYVLRTAEGAYIKLQFDGYYDAAGTAGFVQFSWDFIDPPDSSSVSDTGIDPDTGGGADPDADVSCASGTDLVTTLTDGGESLTVLNSTSSEIWTCFSFSTGGQVETGWDFAWMNWDTTTSFHAEGLALPDQDFDALLDVPEDGWTEGDMDLMDDWYVYDSSTHVLTPKDQVYVLNSASGDTWKLQITTYYAEGDQLHHPTFKWAKIGQ